MVTIGKERHDAIVMVGARPVCEADPKLKLLLSRQMFTYITALLE